MKYELTKQLEDAGFKQCTNSIYCTENCGTLHNPSLSELIEACGDELCVLHFFPKDDEGKKSFGADTWVKNGITKHFVAPTPEEAVAKLWLELNKKL